MWLHKVRNEKSAQRGSFRPDVPADIRPKNFGQALQVLEKQAFWHGHPARTSMKKLRSEKLRADFSFPIKSASLKSTAPRKEARRWKVGFPVRDCHWINTMASYSLPFSIWVASLMPPYPSPSSLWCPHVFSVCSLVCVVDGWVDALLWFLRNLLPICACFVIL